MINYKDLSFNTVVFFVSEKFVCSADKGPMLFILSVGRAACGQLRHGL